MSREQATPEEMNINQKDERIENIEKARVVADAEKPLRDTAREEGVDQKSKEFLDSQAESAGEKAGQEYEIKLEGLRVKANAIKNFIEVQLTVKWGNLPEANRQASADISSEVRYAKHPEEKTRVKNKQLAQEYVPMLEELSAIQEKLDKNTTKSEIGITGIFKDAEQDLGAIEKQLRQNASYYGVEIGNAF